MLSKCFTRGGFSSAAGSSRATATCSLFRLADRSSTGGFTPADMPIVKKKWDAAIQVGKICESMKNVAAGALPAAERHLGNARPYGKVTRDFFDVGQEGDESLMPHVQNVLHISIGTERGMCGSSSSNTALAVQQWITKNDRKKKMTHKLVVYGKRTSAVANTMFGKDLLFSAVEVKTKVPTWQFCCNLAEKMLYEMDFEWDMAKVYFNEYENAVRFWLTDITVYRKDIAHAIADVQLGFYEVEGSDNHSVMVDCLIEYRLASLLYMGMAENFASEQAARLKSMDGATKNCQDMCGDYEKIYQGLRKSKITNELIVLAAAAKMAKSKQ